MNSKDFWTFIVTMVLGGLVYSISSFTYMHNKFATSADFMSQGNRIERVEDRVDERLTRIESKIDRLIERTPN